jgi:hypothetical protein
MQVFKVISNTIAAVGQTIQDGAETLSLAVGDDGLKSTTRFTFGILNNSLEESHVVSGLEKDYNIDEFKKNHAKKVGRPKGSKKNESK